MLISGNQFNPCFQLNETFKKKLKKYELQKIRLTLVKETFMSCLYQMQGGQTNRTNLYMHDLFQTRDSNKRTLFVVIYKTSFRALFEVSSKPLLHSKG